jgi:serine/threonine protein kinase
MLTAGTNLGPYEVVAPLGAGGMGEVYRARDRKLGRDVALKVLPEIFVSDPDRVGRFSREAKTLAALNHPNIAAIHGVEESNGINALVLELVEGPTLAERIAQGPMSLEDTLLVARQIADALEAAHQQGIIHRDLKPANVKVRPDGTVKVLDFGLAKALSVDVPVSSERLANSPTITSPIGMTGVGMLLGTAAYMSPEQAKHGTADIRSDIWAFGCVVYEHVFFGSARTGATRLFRKNLADNAPEAAITEPDSARYPLDMTSDGRIVFQEGSAAGYDLSLLDPQAPAKAPLIGTPFNEVQARVARTTGGSRTPRTNPAHSRFTCARSRAPAGSGRSRRRAGCSRNGRDGRELYYISRDRKLMAP